MSEIFRVFLLATLAFGLIVSCRNVFRILKKECLRRKFTKEIILRMRQEQSNGLTLDQIREKWTADIDKIYRKEKP